MAAALDAELGKLTVLLGAGLDGVNAELTRLGLDKVVPSTEEISGPDLP